MIQFPMVYVFTITALRVNFPMVYVFTITALRVNFTQCSYIVMVSSISTIFTSNYHHQKPIKWTLPYSGKLSGEKTFMNFAVLWLYTKVFSAKFGAWHPLAQQKRAIHESFLCENCIFHQKVFSLESFPLYGTFQLGFKQVRHEMYFVFLFCFISKCYIEPRLISYVSGGSKFNDIHRITCQLRWVWLTPSG